MSIKWSIQTLEDSYLEEKFKRKREVLDKWRASDMGSCFRKRIYTRQGVTPTETMDARTRRVLDTGDIFHWKYQNFLKRIGVLVTKEFEVANEEYNFIGHGDAIVGGKIQVNEEFYKYKNREGKEIVNEKMLEWLKAKAQEIEKLYPDGLPLILYDFKTQHSASLSYVEKGGPQQEHIKQLASYLTFVDKNKYPVEEGRIMYISKDDSRLLEFPIILTPELEQSVKDELISLQSFWDKKVLPPQLEDILEDKGRSSANWRCRFCPYLTHCKGTNWFKDTTIKAEVINKGKKNAKYNNR